MSNNISCNTNNYGRNNVSFQADDNKQQQSKIPIITKPINTVETIVNSTVDTFVPEPKDEEKKKSHKTMISVASTVLVLSAFVAILNPKFSSGLMKKLKTKTANARNKAKVDNSFWGKFNKGKEKFLTAVTNSMQVLNNMNSAKDELFQKICGKTSITKKIHKSISKGFDKISQKTVFSKYEKVNKKMNTLDNIIKQYKDRLSDSDKQILEQKLAEVKKVQEYFGKAQVKSRLDAQETAMNNLERDVVSRIKQYKNNILDHGKNKKDIFTFWAEDALMPTRNKLEGEGTTVVNKLTGDGQTQKGAYKEILELLSPHLKEEELKAIEGTVKKTSKSLKKANHSECVEYFDKKRDLMLGSAPSDVLTALASLILSGVAIGTADTKEDRVTRLVSGVFPIVAGLGVSTALTAMLFSGGKGMALGSLSSAVLSGIGSATTHIIYPKKKQLANDNTQEEQNTKTTPTAEKKEANLNA